MDTKKSIQLAFLPLFFLLFFPLHVYAVNVSILSFPSTISSDAFTITASISGAATGTNYLRVDVYKDSTKNYFGETYNGSDWYSGSDGKQYFPITVQSGKVWNGDIQARIGNPSVTDYDGSGSYRLRIRRYTSSGGEGSEDPNNSSVSVAITFPTLTPTPTTVPTLAPTNTPIPTKVPTSTPTPSKFPTTKPTIKPTEQAVLAASEDAGMVSITDEPSPTKKKGPSVQVAGAAVNTFPVLLVCFGGAGILCGILLFFHIRQKKGIET